MPTSRGHIPTIYEDWLRNGKPSGMFRESISRLQCGSDLSALTTQVMTSVALPLQIGDTVTNLTFQSGATAAGTPTNWWFALYDRSGNLLAQTADQTTTAWAADTKMTVALQTAQYISVEGVYFAAIMVKATTPPSLVGATLGRAVFAGGVFTSSPTQAPLARTSGSALTATAPASIATPSNVATLPYCVAT